MKIYVITDKEGKILNYGENCGKLEKEIRDKDNGSFEYLLHGPYPTNEINEFSNGKMYPVMVQIEDDDEALMEVYESVNSSVFISEPLVDIEFITANKFMICVSTVFNFEEDYEIIRILIKYVFKFIAIAKESVINADNINEIVDFMNKTYPTIPGLEIPLNSVNYEEVEKEVFMTEECKWSCNDKINYQTECRHTYFPYVKSTNQPEIFDGLCPWCGKNIKYNKEDIE